MDGFDVQSIGYVAPALSNELHISRVQLGPVLSAAPLGVLIGSILCSMLADKIGRRPVLIGSTLFYALLTWLTARAGSLEELRIVRVIGGIGMGAIMPNAMALVGEYSPRRSRVTIMMIVSNGFTAGAALGGFVAAWLLPRFGWRSVFYFGAAVPMVIAVLMIVMLPESLQFLALQGKRVEQLGRWLKRIRPSIDVRGAQYVVPDEQAKKGGVTFFRLLHDGRAAGTLLLWTINFMNLLNLYFLQGWLTTVVTDAGYPQATAAIVASMVQVGGTIGAFTLGWFVHKWGFVPVLTTCGVLASINIAAIGQPWISLAMLFTVVFIAGVCVTGGQAAINALAATYYPTELRSTGIGAGLGVGRMGAIIGPTLASMLLGYGWSARDLFLAAAVPPLIAAIAMIAWRFVVGTGKSVDAKAEVAAH
ncbi:MAG: aromatic acid/H+ symport family transporter [Bryobacterales bacterium]|nr:aromatic acid/H+ symport family transporter [Bryobacterales bacterium]